MKIADRLVDLGATSRGKLTGRVIGPDERRRRREWHSSWKGALAMFLGGLATVAVVVGVQLLSRL